MHINAPPLSSAWIYKVLVLSTKAVDVSTAVHLPILILPLCTGMLLHCVGSQIITGLKTGFDACMLGADFLSDMNMASRGETFDQNDRI